MAAPPTEQEALVLRMQDYRDSDRLVWLLTSDEGRLSAVARGARKSQRRFGGHLDLFHRVRVRLSHRSGSSLYGLLGCQTLEPHAALRTDAVRYGAASFVAELVLQLTREGVAEPEIYRTALAAFELLDDTAVSVSRSSLAAISVGLLSVAGFVMDLGACGDCGRDVTRQFVGSRFDPAEGLRCDACAAGRGPARRLEPADATALARWQREPLRAAVRHEASATAVAAGMDLVHHVLGRPLRAERFVCQMLGETTS